MESVGEVSFWILLTQVLMEVRKLIICLSLTFVFLIRGLEQVRSRLFLQVKIDFVLLFYMPIHEARQLNQRTSVNTSETCLITA